jgi:hypothetical protein
VGLISRLLGRRRPTFDAPAAPDPARLEEARREADRSGEVLDQVKAHDRRVTETSERAARALRQNHLGPSFWAWAESLGDRRSP